MPYVDFSMEGYDTDVGNPLGYSALQWFVDADQVDTITDAGSGAVSEWKDLSPNANHLTQATGASRPITGANPLNGLNTIDFDGTDDWMDANDYSVNVSSRGVTWFAVFKWDATGTGKNACYADRSGQAVALNAHMVENNSGTYRVTYGTGASPFAAGNYREVSFPDPGTTLYKRYVGTVDTVNGPRLWIGGVPQTMTPLAGGTANPPNFLSSDSTPWKPHLGRRPDPFYFDGKIATWGFLSTPLPIVEVGRLDSWLYRRWGV